MGIKTKITIDDIDTNFNISSLKETLDGNSDTVYILDENYILKIYEDSSFKIEHEEKVLNLCKELKVPKVIHKLNIKGKSAIIFNKAIGQSLKIANKNHLFQIATFLKNFHNITKNKSFNTSYSYDKKYLENLIKQSKNEYFEKWYLNLDIKLKNDGIIHGDLFIDNAMFYEDKLSCVFDFSDSCSGDFLFDLAVVALSWCQTIDDIKVLINYYDKSLDLNIFLEYVKYASLFYCAKRVTENRSFDDIDYFKKFQ